MSSKTEGNIHNCKHCGDQCIEEDLIYNSNHFCCNGCLQVYRLLIENDMHAFYAMEDTPGVKLNKHRSTDFDIFDDAEVLARFVDFSDNGITRISISLPTIHCSSCIYLLENIHKLQPGIVSSRVNFLKKKATLVFNHEEVSLKEVFILLDKIGYPPLITLNHIDEEKASPFQDKTLWYKIGLTGFSFGNIMLLSFPEYLGFQKASLLFYIGYINIALAIPILLYSARDYLTSAWKSIQIKNLNIDVPVALGIVTLFTKSIYDILSGTGEGYLDSFSGFVFFLLIGRSFQQFTHHSLSFDRNYKSYFPISTKVKRADQWVSEPLDSVGKEDIILVRNGELIPMDGIILKGRGSIDYSFVTGESDPVTKEIGESVFAGGKQTGASLEIKINKKVEQSYITQLWNDDAFQHSISSTSTLVNSISKYFTIVILIIAVLTLLYWLRVDLSTALNTFTAVLIVACPCALALSIPFTYGNLLRLLTKDSFYLKNAEVIEQIQDIDHIVFDKTGTITDAKQMEISFHGRDLTDLEKSIVKSACIHSSHPMSRAIVQAHPSISVREVETFEEFPGQGIVAEVTGHQVKVGSAAFITGSVDDLKGVNIEIDGSYLGRYTTKQNYRKGITTILRDLSSTYNLSLLSGDNDEQYAAIESLFNNQGEYIFNQSPQQKLDYIKSLQQEGKKVMMIGDGLNDAGALMQSDVGVVISDDSNNFTPASDAILSASSFDKLSRFLRIIQKSKYLIYGAFAMAFLYNIIGLGFAITGNLSPVVAAILMPTSSISVIIYGVLASYLVYKKSM